MQAVQKAQIGLYHWFNDSAGYSLITNVTLSDGTTGSINPVSAYESGWQGLNNVSWTSMQPYGYGAINPNQQCPNDQGAVGVWQLPGYYFMSFLCQSYPAIPVWNQASSQEVVTLSVPLLNNLTARCSADFAYGVSMDGLKLYCAHRQDTTTAYPTLGACTPNGTDYYFDGTNGSQKMPFSAQLPCFRMGIT